jgi:hypothetical protein
MLFETIFSETNAPTSAFALKSTKFQELFDPNKLAFILKNEKLFEECSTSNK